MSLESQRARLLSIWHDIEKRYPDISPSRMLEMVVERATVEGIEKDEDAIGMLKKLAAFADGIQPKQNPDEKAMIGGPICARHPCRALSRSLNDDGSCPLCAEERTPERPTDLALLRALVEAMDQCSFRDCTNIGTKLGDDPFDSYCDEHGVAYEDLAYAVPLRAALARLREGA